MSILSLSIIPFSLAASMLVSPIGVAGSQDPPRQPGRIDPDTGRAIVAPQDPLEGKVIVSLAIEGNQRVTKDQVLAVLRTRIGQPYRASDIDADVKTAFAKFAARVEVRAKPQDGGIALTLVFDETRTLVGVEIDGVEVARGRELLDDARLRDVRPLYEAQVEQRAREMEQLLKEDGRYFAAVTLEVVERPDGPHAILHVSEGEKVAVDDIVFDGIGDAVEPDVLRDLMATDTATLGIFDEYLKDDVVGRDLVDIEKFLRREGWRDATAKLSRYEFNEAKDEVIVHVAVEIGPRYTVREIEIAGSATIPEVELRKEFETKVGEPLRMGSITRDQERIVEAYGKLGFARAHVAPRVIFAEEGSLAVVRFEIEEGTEKHVRDVRILGNAATLDEVIRRELTLEPGDLASSTELAHSADHLRALGYFDDAEGHPHVDARFAPTPDPLLEDVYVDVEEAHAGRLFFSAFASTDLGLFGGVQLELDNFDITDTPTAWDPITLFSELIDQRAFHGAGQQLDISLLPGTRVSSYRLTFIEPYLFGPEDHPRSLRVDLYSSASRFEKEFEEIRTGLAVTYGKEWDDYWKTGVTGRLELVDIDDVDDAPDDVDDVEGTNFVPSLGVFARYMDYDSLRDPHRGFEAGARYDILFADGAGQRLVIDEKSKIPLHQDDKGRFHSFNIRSALGLANGFSGDLPFFERFQGGGAIGDFPIRGFEYRGIGPESKDVHLGGHFGYAAAFEYEYPLYSSYDAVFDEHVEYLRGVAFVDIASVEDGFGDLFGETRASAGAGLRIFLPFLGPTPIALDFGFPLLESSDDDTEVLSVRISKRF